MVIDVLLVVILMILEEATPTYKSLTTPPPLFQLPSTPIYLQNSLFEARFPSREKGHDDDAMFNDVLLYFLYDMLGMGQCQSKGL